MTCLISTGSWGVCARGLPHPHTKQKRPITFDPQRAYRRDDVVYVHLNHPLVQQSIRLLRAEVGKPELVAAALYRVTAREVPKHHLPEGKPARAGLCPIGHHRRRQPAAA